MHSSRVEYCARVYECMFFFAFCYYCIYFFSHCNSFVQGVPGWRTVSHCVTRCKNGLLSACPARFRSQELEWANKKKTREKITYTEYIYYIHASVKYTSIRPSLTENTVFSPPEVTQYILHTICHTHNATASTEKRKTVYLETFSDRGKEVDDTLIYFTSSRIITSTYNSHVSNVVIFFPVDKRIRLVGTIQCWWFIEVTSRLDDDAAECCLPKCSMVVTSPNSMYIKCEIV